MDPVFLARIQFALTVGFHYIFPPISIGLGLILVIMEGMYIKTKNPLYAQMTKFWVKIFGLVFAIGVATGIVMEFQFGTNWATYSRYVGDVFGSALAAEGVFAFFLESGFLALLLFGWKYVKPGVHFFSTIMVTFGAHFSAIWIIVANSWMQTPAGHHIVGRGLTERAEITNFWELVFNPSTVDRLTHTIMGAWQTGAWLVISVSAYYLLKKRHIDFAKASIKIAIVVAVVSSLGQLLTGHSSVLGVAEHQPTKLAALEGHYDASASAPLYMWGWVDECEETVRFGIQVPGMLSYLLYGDPSKPVTGLKAFPEDERPPVNIVFQSYHIMVLLGFLLILLSLLAVLFWWRGSLFEKRWLLLIFVYTVVAPQVANQLGWIAAEVGRQPWIVYGILKTSDATSAVVSAGNILASIIMFSLIYILLFVLFLYLLNNKIQRGPEIEEDVYLGSHRA